MTIFTHEVLSDEQLAKEKFGLLEPGNYRFVIIGASAELSSKGNPMIKIILDVEGKKIFDYLMDNGPMRFKIKHILNSIGLGNLYNSGSWDTDMLYNGQGVAKIGVKKGEAKKDGSGMYADQNNVIDYVALASGKDMSPQSKHAVTGDDDIPF